MTWDFVIGVLFAAGALAAIVFAFFFGFYLGMRRGEREAKEKK